MKDKLIFVKGLFAFFLLLLTAMSFSVFACEMADQYRIFPVKKTQDGVICFELNQFRNSRNDFSDIYWIVYPRLIKISDNGKFHTLKKYDRIIVDDTSYTIQMRKLLGQYISDVYKSKQQSPLVLKEFFFAGNKQSYKGITYTADTINGGAEIRLGTESFVINYPEKFLQHINLGLYFDEDSVFVTDSLVKADRKHFGLRFGMSSIRKYETSKSEIYVITLIAGDSRFGWKNPMKEEEMELSPVDSFVYHEPVFHHGNSFDWLFVRPKKP